jgi:uncharacterized protein (DUF2267 family)
MDYGKTIKAIRMFNFIADERTADAAIKAVLGILTSRLHDKSAHHFIAHLPEVLSFERIHGRTTRARNIEFDDYVSEIAHQFCLTNGEARMLINEILYNAKKDIPKDKLAEIEKDLPKEWGIFFRNV